jgi:hypothetical protein
LDADRLRIEALSTREREEAIREGYIDGADESQPSVIAFNTMVAGAGEGPYAKTLRLKKTV